MKLLFVTVAIALITTLLFAAQPKKTFYVTFPYEILAGTAIQVQADDRLSALTSISPTVWTQEEWNDCQPCRRVRVTKP